MVYNWVRRGSHSFLLINDIITAGSIIPYEAAALSSLFIMNEFGAFGWFRHIHSTRFRLRLSVQNTHKNAQKHKLCPCLQHLPKPSLQHQMSTSGLLLLLPLPSLSQGACSLLAAMDRSSERRARLLKLKTNWTRIPAEWDKINLQNKERQGK